MGSFNVKVILFTQYDFSVLSDPIWLQCETVDPDDAKALEMTVKRALKTYGTAALEEMIQNCMAQDLSWKVSKHSTSIITFARAKHYC